MYGGCRGSQHVEGRRRCCRQLPWCWWYRCSCWSEPHLVVHRPAGDDPLGSPPVCRRPPPVMAHRRFVPLRRGRTTRRSGSPCRPTAIEAGRAWWVAQTAEADDRCPPDRAEPDPTILSMSILSMSILSLSAPALSPLRRVELAVSPRPLRAPGASLEPDALVPARHYRPTPSAPSPSYDASRRDPLSSRPKARTDGPQPEPEPKNPRPWPRARAPSVGADRVWGCPTARSRRAGPIRARRFPVLTRRTRSNCVG